MPEQQSSQEQAPPEPEVLGIKELDFNSWLHHPVTRAVLQQYLPDFRAALQRDHVARWEAGALDPHVESEAKGRCNTLNELAELRFEHILEFYGPPEPSGPEQPTEDGEPPSSE